MEIIVFDSVYSRSSNILIEDSVILVEGRISIREDEPVKIVASKITEFNENAEENTAHNSVKTMIIDITDFDEDKKSRLRGAIKFFAGDRANTKIAVKENDIIKPCGALLLNNKIVEIFKEIAGDNNVKF